MLDNQNIKIATNVLLMRLIIKISKLSIDVLYLSSYCLSHFRCFLDLAVVVFVDLAVVFWISPLAFCKSCRWWCFFSHLSGAVLWNLAIVRFCGSCHCFFDFNLFFFFFFVDFAAAMVQKILDELTRDGTVKLQEYGKSKIYYANQVALCSIIVRPVRNEPVHCACICQNGVARSTTLFCKRWWNKKFDCEDIVCSIFSFCGVR